MLKDWLRRIVYAVCGTSACKAGVLCLLRRWNFRCSLVDLKARAQTALLRAFVSALTDYPLLETELFLVVCDLAVEGSVSPLRWFGTVHMRLYPREASRWSRYTIRSLSVFKALEMISPE